MGNNQSEEQKDTTFSEQSKKESVNGRGILKHRPSSYKSRGSSQASHSSNDHESDYSEEEASNKGSALLRPTEMTVVEVPDERKSMFRKLPDQVTDVSEYLQDNNQQMVAKLKRFKIDKHPELGEDFTLYLDLENNFQGVCDFLRESKDLRFDAIRKVSASTHLAMGAELSVKFAEERLINLVTLDIFGTCRS